ncbi:MAG: hypothetical protein ACRYF0_12265 [Janthinobacterium lividum]
MLPDSVRAGVGPRPMRFSQVSDDTLQAQLAHNPARSYQAFGNALVITELWKKARLLYRPAPEADWLEVQLAPVGDDDATGELTLDSARLDPQRPLALLVRVESKASFWGGAAAWGLLNIVELGARPLLLLKSQTLREDISYNRLNDSEYAEGVSTSWRSTQLITVRKNRILVGPVRGEPGNYDMSTLPAGSYGFRNGQIARLSR